MKKQTARDIRFQIELLEVQEKHIALTIRFPPPGCRNVALWRQTQSEALATIRGELIEQRQELARLTSQRELDWTKPE